VPNSRQFREIVAAKVEERQERRAKSQEPEDDGPLDELLQPRLKKRGPPTKEVKFKFAADACENIMLRLDTIGEAEGCESREETLERLINFYWENKPRAGMGAALGLKRVA
jgi:hypothetical protein